MSTSAGVPTVHPINMKGDLANNWEFLKESWTNYKIATELDNKNEKTRVATLLAKIDKEELQIYCHLPMTKEEWKNLKKTGGLLQAQRYVIYERYVLFSRDQEANETFNAYLAALRILAFSCEFPQLEEELIRDRIGLGKKDSGIRACMLIEPSMTLHQTAMMC